MGAAIPVLGTGVVGLLVGPLFALVFEWPVGHAALWGLAAGLAFGLLATLVLALGP